MLEVNEGEEHGQLIFLATLTFLFENHYYLSYVGIISDHLQIIYKAKNTFQIEKISYESGRLLDTPQIVKYLLFANLSAVCRTGEAVDSWQPNKNGFIF